MFWLNEIVFAIVLSDKLTMISPKFNNSLNQCGVIRIHFDEIVLKIKGLDVEASIVDLGSTNICTCSLE